MPLALFFLINRSIVRNRKKQGDCVLRQGKQGFKRCNAFVLFTVFISPQDIVYNEYELLKSISIQWLPFKKAVKIYWPENKVMRKNDMQDSWNCHIVASINRWRYASMKCFFSCPFSQSQDSVLWKMNKFLCEMQMQRFKCPRV